MNKLDNKFFQRLSSEAANSPRKRSHYNLHNDLAEPVQRLCIALKKGTYVRPHYHPQKNKWELMLCLKGSVCLIIFNKEGEVLERLLLNPGEPLAGIEIDPNTWHTVFPLTDEAIIIEIKEGPYIPTKESDFAKWSPKEGDVEVNKFLEWMEKAKPGETY